MRLDSLEEFGAVDQVGQVIELLGFEDHHAREIIPLEPIFVEPIEPGQITFGNALLHGPSAFFDALLQRIDRTSQVHHEVRRPQHCGDGFVEAPIRLKVTLVDVSLLGQILREDFGIFVNGPVLQNRLGLGLKREMKAKLVGQKVELRTVGPSLHVGVKVGQIRILVIGLEKRLQVVLLTEKARQFGFTRANVSGHCDELILRHDGPRL